jgi:hypothetical protein
MTKQNKDARNLAELISKLTAVAIWDHDFQQQLPTPSFSTADKGLGTISFTGRMSLALLDEAVENLRSLMPNRNEYSREFCKASLLRHLRERRNSNERSDTADPTALLQSLRQEPSEQHQVFRAVYGAAIQQRSSPIVLGPCTFYCPQTHISYLKGCGLGDEEARNWFGDSGLLVAATVRAVDKFAANALADSIFSTAESLIALAETMGRRYRRVTIVSEHASYWRPSLICTGPTTHLRTENLGPVELVTLETDAFLSPAPAMARLWRILGAASTNKWEGRLLRAAKWLGAAFLCHDGDSAIVRTATALESLLFVDPQDPYTPSRTATISENAAHVVGADIEHCLDVQKRIKDLYSARSSTVHSGDAGLTADQLFSHMCLARDVLFRLLAGDEWKEIESPEAFRYALSRKRYSYRSPHLPKADVLEPAPARKR